MANNMPYHVVPKRLVFSVKIDSRKEFVHYKCTHWVIMPANRARIAGFFSIRFFILVGGGMFNRGCAGRNIFISGWIDNVNELQYPTHQATNDKRYTHRKHN